jgi:CRISPR-associated protein Csd1
MSWMQKLYETYNNCEGMVGYSADESKRPLLPVCHITAQANIEIILDEEAHFRSASLITNKNDATTIIPCTEGSASRSGSKPQCHPLCDSLQYVAGDFEKYGGIVTSGFSEEWTITKDKIEKAKLKWKDVFKKMNANRWVMQISKTKLRLTANLENERENIKNIFRDDFPKIMSCFEQSEPYMDYIKILTDWCESNHSHPKAQTILKYVRKKSLFKDLIDHKILFVGDDGKLLAKRQTKKEKNAPPDIFDIVGSQDKASVRWMVEKPGDLETKVWKDKTLWESWSKFYLSTRKKEPICFITGENAILSNQHPKYIRAKGDGAKIISSNDTSGFVFRGRFLAAEQAFNVSLEVSQKSHNALIWLIDKQGTVFWVKGDNGRREPGLTILAWALSGKPIPKPTDDPLAILGFDELPNDRPVAVTTAQDAAIKFKERMLGYSSNLGKTDNIIVIGLDSASKGRLAITYYREDLSGSDFLKRIEDWHKTCEWLHEYRYKNIKENEAGKYKRCFQPFIGAPAPADIAEAAYATNRNGKVEVDEKLLKATMKRLLPCIIDGQPIPRDLVESAVRRACNRIALKEPNDKYEREWNKTLSIACALYKKFQTKEKFNMALDETRTTRDYLYGRLLAIADRLEGQALYKAKEKRDTNAARYMPLFAEHPFKTWRQIELSLVPYKARLNGAQFYMGLIDQVMLKFAPDSFKNDKPLCGEFLLGFHCQRAELRKKKPEEAEEIENEE